MVPTTPTVQVKTRLAPADAQRLDALAAATRRNRSQLLRLAVDRLLTEPLVLAAPPRPDGDRG